MTKILSQKPVLKTDFFTIFEDNVELSPGKKRLYLSGVRKPSVAIFPIGNKDEIYLIDQYRYIHKKRLIEAVAGIIEDGESPLSTAKRELEEEAGITASKWEKIGSTTASGSFITWNQHLFIAKDLSFRKQKLEESEDIILIKMPLKKAVKKVVNGEINTSTTSFGILLIEYLIKNKKL